MHRTVSWSSLRGRERSSTFSDSWERRDSAEDGGVSVTVSRRVSIPDNEKCERCLRLPEYGPRVCFFSGGSAIKGVSECLKHYSHNTIHLITPFDSGGSSAEIRRAFDMLSVGDLRSRLMALADDSALGRPEVAALFSHRLDANDATIAAEEFSSILSGEHALAANVSMPMRSILLSHLRWFHRDMPSDFDLKGASIGNLIITGCFLEHDRDIVTAIYLIWTLIQVKGRVRPLTGANLHIRTMYSDGTEEVGQHRLGKSKVGAHGRILGVDLVDSLSSSTERQEAQSCSIDPVSADLVGTADLIVFPMGSFFGSICINLVPEGVGKAVVRRKCPKIYIPNTGTDPEMFGYSIAECANLIVDLVRKDAGENTPVHDIIHYILLDTKNCEYCVPIDRKKISSMGVQIIDVPLTSRELLKETQSTKSMKFNRLDPKKVVEVLVSIGS